jgi:16S rRNA (uracil1498-N3)-methyltransferase
VLRLRRGATVVVADGRGRWGLAAFRGPGEPAERALEAVGPVVAEAPPDPVLTVAFAPAKGDRTEWMVQKLTELGVDRLVALQARRSVVRWEGARVARSLERLHRVAREAAAQSRGVWLPAIEGVSTLGALQEGSAVALAHPGGSAPSLACPTIAVGPEGGWTPEEVATCQETVDLGPTVLRTETAAVAAGVLLCALRAGTVAAVGESPR